MELSERTASRVVVEVRLGKSITYGRLSPPLSAFNHTLCEQNIKTCPFVCRRETILDHDAGVASERVAKRLASRSSIVGTIELFCRFREFTWNKVLRGALS